MQSIKMPQNDKNFLCAHQFMFNSGVALKITSNFLIQICTKRRVTTCAKFWDNRLIGFWFMEFVWHDRVKVCISKPNPKPYLILNLNHNPCSASKYPGMMNQFMFNSEAVLRIVFILSIPMCTKRLVSMCAKFLETTLTAF